MPQKSECKLLFYCFEMLKIVNGLVDYRQNVFRLSRSGSNDISKPYNDGNVNSGVEKIEVSVYCKTC